MRLSLGRCGHPDTRRLRSPTMNPSPRRSGSCRRPRFTTRWNPSALARRPRGCCSPGQTTAIPTSRCGRSTPAAPRRRPSAFGARRRPTPFTTTARRTCSTTSRPRIWTASRALRARPSRSTSAWPCRRRPPLLSVSLDGAIALAWADNAHDASPARFADYRVYSAAYDLDTDLCDVDWFLEGTTVAPEFVAGALPNGQPRCFAVTAVSIEGYESLWSPIRADTPRPDARNIVLLRRSDPAQSGFRFWKDLNGDFLVQPSELGLVGSGHTRPTSTSWSSETAPGGLRFRRCAPAPGVEFYANAPGRRPHRHRLGAEPGLQPGADRRRGSAGDTSSR